MRFTLTIDCGNAAFGDDPQAEIGIILEWAALRIHNMSLGESVPLRDTNGNRVGKMELVKTGSWDDAE